MSVPWERVLPGDLRDCLEELGPAEWTSLEEVRLRAGFPMSVTIGGAERTPDPWKKRVLTEADLRRVLEVAGGGSVHTILDQLRAGYVTASGGVRLGVCGSGAVEGGVLRTFRTVTSLAIRAPRTLPGIARPLIPQLLEEGRLLSTLILLRRAGARPPCSGT